jgi:hypothetical protein
VLTRADRDHLLECEELLMDNEIQLISDGDGVAVIGDPAAVELFLSSEGLQSTDLQLPRLSSLFNAGAGLADVGSAIAAGSGRWVKLSEQSAALLKTHQLMAGSAPGLSRAVITNHGSITNLIEIVTSPASMLLNPAILSGVGGLMSQMAMKKAIEDIADYLAVIDEKVDDILRAQKDAVIADMIADGLVIDDALKLRERTGRVSEVTWSKVQATPRAIARTQAYALRQLDALAEKLENKKDVNELATASKVAESTVREWLAVLARCFQLQDTVAILELDRVLDSAPNELDAHRLALKDSRQTRLELIERSTRRLMVRMDAAAARANIKVLLHPFDSRVVVHATNFVGSGVSEFHKRLGIAGDREALDARRWMEAAVDMRDKVLDTSVDVKDKVFEAGVGGVDAAARLGSHALDRAKAATDKLSSRLAERAERRRGDGDAGDEQA